MIKFNFRLNKGKTITATVPEGWHEVKLKHVIKLEESDNHDLSSLLEAFTGINYEFIENASAKDIWGPVFQLLSYVYDAPKWNKIAKRKKVDLGGKLITPPLKIETKSFGQSRLVLHALRNHLGEKTIPVNILPEIIAIYLQPAYDGKFISDRVSDIKEMVLNMPAYMGMPYAFFFSKKFRGSKVYGMIGLKVSQKMLRNLISIHRQAGTNSLNLTT